MDASNTIINKFFDQYDKCTYEYDLGDSWNHEIVVEKRLKDTKNNSIPVCLGGARHRPPEDAGGIGGYENFLNIINDKNNTEREDMLVWAEKDTGGRIFDPEYFNIKETNRMLRFSLENNYETSVKLFTGKGLEGTVDWDGIGTCVEVNGKSYSWKWLGKMLLRLGGGSNININVNHNKY